MLRRVNNRGTRIKPQETRLENHRTVKASAGQGRPHPPAVPGTPKRTGAGQVRQPARRTRNSGPSKGGACCLATKAGRGAGLAPAHFRPRPGRPEVTLGGGAEELGGGAG